MTLRSNIFTSNQQQSSLNDAIQQLEGEYIPNVFQGTLIQNDLERQTENAVTLNNTLTLHWQPWLWLPLDATGGINTIRRTDVGYIPYGINSLYIGDLTFSSGGASVSDTTGFYSVGNGSSQNNTLSIGTVIPIPLAKLALGGNIYSQSTADGKIFTNFLSPGVTVPTQFLQFGNTGSSSVIANSPYAYSTTSQTTYGWYVSPTFNFNTRFFVTPGFRLDGGSGGTHTTTTNGGLSAFPKIDLSYVAVDRQGGHDLGGVLTLLRPRLALGVAGIQPRPQDKLRLFNLGLANGFTPGGFGPVSITAGNSGNPHLGRGICQPLATLDGGTTAVPLACLNAIGNPNLIPERDRSIEGGLDATFWHGRLSMTYTQYNKTANDAIFPIPVAASVDGGNGVTEVQFNIGEIRNTGREMTVNATLVESRALSWNMGLIISNNNSLVVHLNPGLSPICVNAQPGGFIGANCNGEMIRPGYPLFGMWAQPIASFADANHDGIIEPDEVRLADSSVFVGQPNPKYQYTVNSGITLLDGRLSVNAEVAYVNGLTQNNTGACNSAAFANLPNAPGTSLAAQAAVVAANCQFLGTSGVPNHLGSGTPIGLLQTVSTLRFNSLSINYNVPRSLASWFHVPNMSVALQGANLGLVTNYRGKDPDVNAFSTASAGDQTADLGQLPLPRTWWLKIGLGNN